MTHAKHTAHNPEASKKQLPEEEEMESPTMLSTSEDNGEPFYDANQHHKTADGDQPPEEGDRGESQEEEQETKLTTKKKKKKKPHMLPEDDEDLPSTPKKKKKKNQNPEHDTTQPSKKFKKRKLDSTARITQNWIKLMRGCSQKEGEEVRRGTGGRIKEEKLTEGQGQAVSKSPADTPANCHGHSTSEPLKGSPASPRG